MKAIWYAILSVLAFTVIWAYPMPSIAVIIGLCVWCVMKEPGNA